MPAILTHYTFAKFEGVNPERKHFGALVLGSQGPDPFFFYGMLPWKKREGSKVVNTFGSGLHKREVTALYMAMIDYANKSEDKELLFDFIEGIYLHYILDRNCHPFVYSHAGYKEDDSKEAKYYSAFHTKFESAIDFIYAKEKGVFNENPVFSLKTVSDEELHKISKMIYEANKASDNVPGLDENSYFTSVKDYAAIMKFVNKPHGLKRWFLKTFFGRDAVAFALNYPRNLEKTYGKVDFMNATKEEWPDPVSGEKRKESWYDLMDNAKKEYLSFLPLLEKAKNGEDISKEAHEFYAGIDHNGVKDGATKKYMSPVLPYVEGK